MALTGNRFQVIGKLKFRKIRKNGVHRRQLLKIAQFLFVFQWVCRQALQRNFSVSAAVRGKQVGGPVR